MQDFIIEPGNKQGELLTAFLFDTFGLPATRRSLATLSAAQKISDHNWQGHKVVFHGNGIRFQRQTSGGLFDYLNL